MGSTADGGTGLDVSGAHAGDKAPEDTSAATGAPRSTGSGVGGGTLGTSGAYAQPTGGAEDRSLTGAGYIGTGTGTGISEQTINAPGAGSGYRGSGYTGTGIGVPEQTIIEPGAGATSYGAQPTQPTGAGYTGSGYEGRERAGEAVGEEGHKPGMMEKVKACSSLSAVLLVWRNCKLHLLVFLLADVVYPGAALHLLLRCAHSSTALSPAAALASPHCAAHLLN
jgi:hypothetical protein